MTNQVTVYLDERALTQLDVLTRRSGKTKIS